MQKYSFSYYRFLNHLLALTAQDKVSLSLFLLYLHICLPLIPQTQTKIKAGEGYTDSFPTEKDEFQYLQLEFHLSFTFLIYSLREILTLHLFTRFSFL